MLHKRPAPTPITFIKRCWTPMSFPVFIYDPRKGQRFKERLSLAGNPNVKEDWYVNPKTGEPVDFITFARSEGRFSKHFDNDGNASAVLLATKQERLENWRLLQ